MQQSVCDQKTFLKEKKKYKQPGSDAEMTAQDAKQNCSHQSVLIIAGFLLISAVSILNRVDLYYMSQKIHTLGEIIAKQVILSITFI